MVGSLDPHSEFLDADSIPAVAGRHGGPVRRAGPRGGDEGRFVTVVAPMEDTPGFRAGILSGDRIIKVEGKSVEKMPLPDVVKLLRGDPGTR
jgi:carboxyl-terminal processing protease